MELTQHEIYDHEASAHIVELTRHEIYDHEARAHIVELTRHEIYDHEASARIVELHPPQDRTMWRNSVRLWRHAQFYNSVPSTDELGDSSIPELNVPMGRFMDAAAAASAGHRVN